MCAHSDPNQIYCTKTERCHSVSSLVDIPSALPPPKKKTKTKNTPNHPLFLQVV